MSDEKQPAGPSLETVVSKAKAVVSLASTKTHKCGRCGRPARFLEAGEVTLGGKFEIFVCHNEDWSPYTNDRSCPFRAFAVRAEGGVVTHPALEICTINPPIEDVRRLLAASVEEKGRSELKKKRQAESQRVCINSLCKDYGEVFKDHNFCGRCGGPMECKEYLKLGCANASCSQKGKPADIGGTSFLSTRPISFCTECGQKLGNLNQEASR